MRNFHLSKDGGHEHGKVQPERVSVRESDGSGARTRHPAEALELVPVPHGSPEQLHGLGQVVPVALSRAH